MPYTLTVGEYAVVVVVHPYSCTVGVAADGSDGEGDCGGSVFECGEIARVVVVAVAIGGAERCVVDINGTASGGEVADVVVLACVVERGCARPFHSERVGSRCRASVARRWHRCRDGGCASTADGYDTGGIDGRDACR